MAHGNQQIRSEVTTGFQKARESIDNALRDIRGANQKMMTVNQDEVLKLGSDVIEKSLEHSRALLNQNAESWNRQFEEAGAGATGSGVR